MYQEQSTKTNMACQVAIDWADQKHDLLISHQGELIEEQLENIPHKIHAFFLDLLEKNSWQKIQVVIESNHGVIMQVLSSIELIDLQTIHPTQSANYRNAFYPSGAKSDQIDCKVLLEVLQKHPEMCRTYLEKDDYSVLDQFNIIRRKFVDTRTTCTNQLISVLKMSFPVAFEMFKDSHFYSKCVVKFLTKWKDLKALKASSDTVIKNFLKKQRCSESNIEKRLDLIEQAEDFSSPKIQVFAQFQIKSFLAQIELLNEQVTEIETKIAKWSQSLEIHKTFETVPGAGPALLPRIIAFFGDPKKNEMSLEDALLKSQIAPIKFQSGKSCSVRRRFLCDAFTQLTFVEFANGSRRYSLWAKNFYDKQKAKGKKHNTILRALSFKWIRILYACWKSGKPYKEETYLDCLQKKSSPYANDSLENCS